MTKILYTLLISLIFSGSALGAEPIYVVNMQRVINESIAGKAARTNLESEVKKKEASLTKEQEELRKIRDDIEKQKSLLSADALKEKQSAFTKRERDFQKVYQTQREEIVKKNNEAIGKIVKEIDDLIEALAKDKGYKLVIERDARFVLFVDSQYDLTQQVIDALNKKKLD